MTTVAEIFDLAERCFEMRVAQLLHEKRTKAERNGVFLNTRKAKRDARTAAGKEKVDALVRRLANLALIQERVIAQLCPDSELVGQAVRGVVGIQLSAIITAASPVPTEKVSPVAFREGEAVLYPRHVEVTRFKNEQCCEPQEHSDWVTQSVVNHVLDQDAESDLTSQGSVSYERNLNMFHQQN